MKRNYAIVREKNTLIIMSEDYMQSTFIGIQQDMSIADPMEIMDIFTGYRVAAKAVTTALRQGYYDFSMGLAEDIQDAFYIMLNGEIKEITL